jgi:DNA-binding NtrC family response regulator
MGDALMLADARPARPARPLPAALELFGESPAIVRVRELVRRAAALDSCVLITTEAGMPVDSIARELHARSRQSTAAFVIVECGLGDPARVERLLFGAPPVEAPADLESVSADSQLAAARGGALFLRDVTELPATAQARLARIARDGEVRLDGLAVATGFRIIATATREIDADVHAHLFRADLYRRLCTIRIDVPPLRDRADDVPVLAARLLDHICAGHGIGPRTFTQPALSLLAALTWPGNVAELHDAIERAVAGTRDGVIQVEQLIPALHLHRAPPPFVPSGNLREARMRFERDYIAAVLQHHGWRMAAAAHTLGMQRPNLYRKARQLGITLGRVPE